MKQYRRLILVLSLFVSLTSIGSVSYAVDENEKKTTEQRTMEALQKLKEVAPIRKDLMDRVMAGEKAPGTGGATFENILDNHMSLFTDSGAMDELKPFMLASYGIDGGSCLGTKPVPEMWCKECLVHIPLVGCVAMFLPQARAYRYPTQVTEVAHNPNQSDFTLDLLFQIASKLKFGNHATSFVWKTITENAHLKPKYIQFFLMNSARRAAQGEQLDVGGLVSALQQTVFTRSISNQVMETIRQHPQDKRGEFVSLPDASYKQYGHMAAPMLGARVLAETLSETNLTVPSIGVLIVPGSIQPVFFQDNLIVHVNKPPYEPQGFDFEGSQYLSGSSPGGDLALSDDRVQLADNSLLGGGTMSDLPGLGKMPGFGGFGGGFDKLARLEGITNSGRRFRRSAKLGFFDMVGSQLVNPIKAPAQMGTYLESTLPFLAFNKAQVLGGTIPGFQELIREPMRCAKPDVRKSAVKLDFSNSEVKKIEALISLFVPGFSLNGFNTGGLKKLPTCLPFGRAASTPVTTILNTADIGSVVNKAVYVDAAFVPEYTKVGRVFGGSSSLNFYRNDFDVAVPNDWQDIEEILKVNMDSFLNGEATRIFGGYVDGFKDRTQIDERLVKARGFGTSPSGCAHPLRSSEVRDASAQQFPLSPTTKEMTWTAFKRCPVGSPTGPGDRIFGVPIFDVINIGAGLAGVDFQIHRFDQRIE